jgi:tetratricopeptide (TPR) repeat protein
VLLAAAAGGTYFAYEEYRVSRLARRVRESLVARRYQAVSAPLRRWLAARPGSGEAYCYLAWSALAADQPREAAAALERAGKLGANPALLESLLAVYQARSKGINEAEPILVQAFRQELEPRALVAKELARIYLSTYRLTQAAEAIERWRTLAPEDPQPYLWSNEIASRSSDGLPSVLIGNYRDALARDPNLAEARLGLAEQLAKDHQFDEAQREYRAYLERNPQDASALVGLARIAFQNGDIENTSKCFEAALKVNPRQPDALKELAWIDLRFGRAQQACARLQLLTEIEPYEPGVRYSYAQALKYLGDRDGARAQAALAARLRKELDQLLELQNSVIKDSRNVASRFEVAKWMLEHGHHQEGLQWTNEILRTDPHHAPTHRLLADYYRNQGDSGLANYHRVMASAGPE